MEVGHATPTVLTLDLRARQERGWPKITHADAADRPSQADFRSFTACALLVAVDTEAAYSAWRQRFRPLYFSSLPYVILLDPYSAESARRALRDGAADCCAMDDTERLALIVTRLELQMPREGNGETSVRGSNVTSWLQTILDALPSPIFVKDRDYRYTMCNKAFAGYAGKSHAEIVGATVYQVWPEETARIYDKADRELMEHGGTQLYETDIRDADGTYHEVVFHKSVFLDALGHADGIAGTMLDITERKHLERRLEAAASTDFLTGIYNLRAFHELADRVFQGIARHGTDVALIAIDLDHFKAINDLHGHEAGDAALRMLVDAVMGSLREQDVFARTGGDEFCVLLPSTPAAAAAAVAERIRVAINRLSIESPNGTTLLSISAGITLFQPEDRRVQDALRRADEALYEAKAAGRNRVLRL